MQFACENCKTQLQIADEKVRGKRLIVRCKRCGAKIAIADPALGGPKGPRLVAPGFPAARSAPQPRPAQPEAGAPRPAPAPQSHAARDTDIENTRAMESEVLEKALRASKQDASGQAEGLRDAPADSGGPGVGDAQHAPLAAPADEALWFAMLRGVQTGPLSRAELTARANAGEVGPRTYLWREGMDAWQRAKDVSELTFLFPQHPFAAPRPSAPPIAAPESSAPPPVAAKPEAPAAQAAAAEPAQPLEATAPSAGERVHGEEVGRDLFTPAETRAAQKVPADLARWASDELARKRDSSPQQARAGAPSRMFEGAAPPRSRGPFGVFMVLMALGVAGAVLWGVLGPSKEKAAEALPDAGQSQVESAGDAGKAAVAEPPPAAAEPPAPAHATAPPTPVPIPGLTADQVRKKLDEHKPALQGCVDEALRRDPHLRLGRIHIATTIAPSGQVTAARIDRRAVEEAPLGACLRKATRKIVFPQFTGEPFDVDIPIVVSAGN
ncbi:MAG TPA: GYF domain-containing protein [Myxococcales bacterium]|nr:GYF domain-containing protein [Myxococcales bacterium]